MKSKTSFFNKMIFRRGYYKILAIVGNAALIGKCFSPYCSNDVGVVLSAFHSGRKEFGDVFSCD